MGENNSANNKMVCPICGKEFADVHAFSSHMVQHSNEEKRREETEKKHRLEVQKHLDEEKLQKLKAIYEEAANAYSECKKEFEEKYGENDELPSLWDLISSITKDRNMDWYF